MKNHLPIIGVAMMVIVPMNVNAQTGGWIESTMAAMTLEEKVGQLFVPAMTAVYSHRDGPNVQRAKELVRKHHVGGFYLSGGTVTDAAIVTNILQQESRLPLLISADLEAGMRMHLGSGFPRFVTVGGTALPTCMAIGATGNPQFAYESGRITAREARAVGIHWVYGPVADVNSNPRNPIINTRSYGEDPAQVAAMVGAYIRGAQEERVIATLKHFPGHGDTEEDTHLQLPSLPFDRARLDAVEFIPFKAGIGAGAKSVMTAHIALPGIDPEKRPATLSPVILDGLLREHLGFDGLIITDGMIMQGVTDHYGPAEAAILAIEAGADVILLPADLAEASRGLLDAVRSGRISESRLDKSVRLMLAAKAWAGLDRQRLVKVEDIVDLVSAPSSERQADAMFDAAMTLLRNQGAVVPLSPAARVHIVTMTDEPNFQIGEALSAEMKPAVRSVALSHLWNDSSADAISRTVGAAQSADVIVLGIYLSIGPWKGQLGFSPTLQKFFDQVASLKKPVVTITFGDPYVIEKLPATDVMLAAYSGARKAEEAAGRVLLGRTAVQGKLPVGIPGKFGRGEGIRLAPAAR